MGALAVGARRLDTAPMATTGRRIRNAALLGAAAAALVAGACSGSDGADGDPGPTSSDASTPASEASVTTVTTEARGASATIEVAVVFTDPDGVWAPDISPEWSEATERVGPDIEAWLVGTGTEGFRDNVNVLTQNAQGADLRTYLDLSSRSLGGLDLVASEVTTAPDGREIGLVEYSGVVPTAPEPVRAVASVIVVDDRAVVATLTASRSTFDQARAEVEPYLLTLRPASR
jgi:hypothetical protein